LSRKEEINAEAQRRRGGAYRGTAPGVPGRGRDTLGTAGETPALHRCHGRGCPRDCRRDASVTQMSWARMPSGLPAGRQRYTDVMGETPSGLPARRQRYVGGHTELHLGLMGRMPMPRQARTGSFFTRPSVTLRLCVNLLFSSLLPRPVLAGYPPETEGALSAKQPIRYFVALQVFLLNAQLL